jgi:hypothetical protein
MASNKKPNFYKQKTRQGGFLCEFLQTLKLNRYYHQMTSEYVAS